MTMLGLLGRKLPRIYSLVAELDVFRCVHVLGVMKRWHSLECVRCAFKGADASIHIGVKNP